MQQQAGHFIGCSSPFSTPRWVDVGLRGQNTAGYRGLRYVLQVDVAWRLERRLTTAMLPELTWSSFGGSVNKASRLPPSLDERGSRLWDGRNGGRDEDVEMTARRWSGKQTTGGGSRSRAGEQPEVKDGRGGRAACQSRLSTCVRARERERAMCCVLCPAREVDRSGQVCYAMLCYAMLW
jgi:hypothetical protein